MDINKKFQILVNKLNAGQFDEVIFESTLLNKKFPKEEVFINLLSLSHQGKGDYDKSIELLNREIKKNPKNFNYLNNLGLSYLKVKNYNDAELNFLKAIEINPRFINTLNNIATLYVDLNDNHKAEKYLRKSLEINSNILQTNYNLATILQSLGKFNEAKKFFLKTLEINENFTRGDFGLTLLEKYNKENKHIKEMEVKIKNESINKFDLRFLYFGLAKVYEDINDYEKSFKYLELGNKLKKNLTGYNINNDKKNFKKIISFHKEKILKKKELIKNEKKIIFIVGMPRTGTTMAEQIISSHSEVYGAGEISLLSYLLNKFFSSDIKDQDVNQLFEMYKSNYMNFLNKMTDSNIITDKAPLNFKWIGIIKMIFPNSKIIHCTRDKLENSWSIYKNEFEQGMLFSNSFKDIVDYYELHDDIMNFWKDNYSKDIFELNYEELVNNSEQKIKDLIKFCELDWERSCLEFYKNKKSIKTVSFDQARNPIYKTSLKGSEKFKKYLIGLDKALKG